jgi:Fe(3+) dicitrate transport protein
MMTSKTPKYSLIIAFSLTGHVLVAQIPEYTIEGVVSGTTRRLQGATVFLDGSPATITGINGEFSIVKVSPGEHALMFSALGFQSVNRTATVEPGHRTYLEVTLAENITILSEVVVTAFKPMNGIGRIPDVKEGIIYSGKKTEVLVMDSLVANTSQNILRQVLGKIPGANVSETENAGLPSNGIGLRGLNPVQSTSMNLRQNGYNIAADIFGYPEAYYTPPTEALQRVEVVRGAASLQFGPQFGGMFNYVTRDGDPSKPLAVQLQNTSGSYGLFNSFVGVGGTMKRFNYYSYFQYRGLEGWRPNSDMHQVSGFGKVSYRASDRLKFGIEYSLLRNYIHMPGGLTDAQFDQDPRQSVRSRNWLNSPWNILSGNFAYKVSSKTALYFKSSYLFSQRNLVWDGQRPNVPDSITPSVPAAYQAREVQKESFKNSTGELRLQTSYTLGNAEQVVAGGVRYSYAYMTRISNGPGSTGSDFDLSLSGPPLVNLQFTTANAAVFVENVFNVEKRFSVTPGFRYEFIRSTVQGYTDIPVSAQIKQRSFPLFGIGNQFRISSTTNIYANWSQAYSPITYNSLTPQATVSRIDPNMKDSYGWNSDFGWRGTLRDFLNFDIGGFLLAYNNHIGLVTDNGGNTIRTNTGSSLNSGVEAYAELNIIKLVSHQSKIGYLSVFNSFLYNHARYISGEYSGNEVEYAPEWVERFGLTYTYKKFSSTFQLSHQSRSFSDANNTRTASNEPQIGVIPAYQVIDWSATYGFMNQYNIKFGVNNLANAHYFTLRTDEYPGPGIIPAIGRTWYVGFGARF